MSCDTPEDTSAKLPVVHQTQPRCSSSFPQDQDNSFQIWTSCCVSHLHKIFLTSSHTFFSVFASSVRKTQRLETESWVVFLPSAPNAEVGCNLVRPTSFSMKLPLGSVGSLGAIFSTSSVLLSCRAGQQEAIQNVFGFHQSKVGEGGRTAPVTALVPLHPHDLHRWQQRCPQFPLLGPDILGHTTKRSHPFTARFVCFVSKIAALGCSTHSVTKPCPGGNPPPFGLPLYLLAF